MRARVVAVTSASRTAKDGKRVFVIECELDSVVWSVLRRERQVSELHVTLSQLMRFVPDSPIAPRSWIWGRAAEQDGAVAKRVEDLVTGSTYRFRAAAENSVGLGKYSRWTPNIMVTNERYGDPIKY